MAMDDRDDYFARLWDELCSAGLIAPRNSRPWAELSADAKTRFRAAFDRARGVPIPVLKLNLQP
jgi:hypothetical protein